MMMIDAVPQQADNQYPHFSPTGYLLSIVQHAVKSGQSVRIGLAGQGEIFVWPCGEMYAAHIETQEFWRAPAARFEVTAIGDDATPPEGVLVRHIKELLWQAAFHASRGRLIDGCHKFDVVQFTHWPNLTRLPSTPNAARICALLVRNPTTIMIVRSMLKIEAAEVCQIYSAAHCAGFANILNRKGNEMVIATDSEDDPTPAPAKIGNKLGILSLLRAKLVSF